MQIFGDELGKIFILSTEQAKTLEAYIHKKFTNYSDEEYTMVFNDAVLKVLNREFEEFDLEKRQVLETLLLEDASNRYEFFINGYDVVRGIITVEKDGPLAVALVERWLGQHPEIEEPAKLLEDLQVFLEPQEQSIIIINDEILETQVVELDTYPEPDEPLDISEVPPDFITPDDVRAFFRLLIRRIKKIKRVKLTKNGRILVWSFSLLFIIMISGFKNNNEEKSNIAVVTNVDKTASVDVIEIVTKEIDFDPTMGVIETNVIVSTIPSEVLSTNHPLISFKKFDEEALREYLAGRESLLSESPYFEAIVDTAKAYNLNPLLLFAIAGQEQGFVTKSGKNAYKIANNPFNVFGSWQKYNTDIYDTSAIASRTVVMLSQGCPEGMNPITWINRKYAEDKNWWIGVVGLLEHMEDSVGYL